MKCVSLVLLVVCAVIFGQCADAYRFRQSRITMSAGRDGGLLKKINAAVCMGSIAACTFFGTPAFAAVGEGDLPPGALAFSKLLKYQGEWDKLANSIKSRQAEIDEKEIQGIKIFLKQLANEYYDMELVGKGILDPAKAEKAKEIATAFRKQIRECDDAASAGKLERIVELYPTTAGELKDLFALLQDVPDEI